MGIKIEVREKMMLENPHLNIPTVRCIKHPQNKIRSKWTTLAQAISIQAHNS